MSSKCKVTWWWKYVFIVTGDALRCWTCSSDLDPHCADPFNNTSPSFNLHHTLTDCNTQSSPHYSLYKTKSVCKKIKQTGKYICRYILINTVNIVGESLSKCDLYLYHIPRQNETDMNNSFYFLGKLKSNIV